ncbi:hypothetical protein LTR17_001283 [Elasticomyces elasticus]|nr:hypothetical protein LTR17_001283 [Elasticomyces elasticus]
MTTTTFTLYSAMDALTLIILSFPAVLFLIIAGVFLLAVAHGLLGFTLSCITDVANDSFRVSDVPAAYNSGLLTKKGRKRMRTRALQDRVSDSQLKEETEPAHENCDTALPDSDTTHVQDSALTDVVDIPSEQVHASQETTNDPAAQISTPNDAKAHDQHLPFFLAFAIAFQDAMHHIYFLRDEDTRVIRADFSSAARSLSRAITTSYILQAHAPKSMRELLRAWNDQLQEALASIDAVAHLADKSGCAESLDHVDGQMERIYRSKFEEGVLVGYEDLADLWYVDRWGHRFQRNVG